MEEKRRLSCMSAAGRKEGAVGRLSQAFPLIQQDILSPVLPLCFLRGWESSPFSVERSCTYCTRSVRTRAACLVEREREEGGGGFCTRVHAGARAYTHTSRRGDPPPNVTTTPTTHWLPS